MKDNNITEIYQYVKPEYTDEAIDHFLKKMAENHIDVYILDGEPEWSYKDNYHMMKNVLDKVRGWNDMVNRRCRIKGILYDVEPYVLDKWHNIPDQLLEEYTSNLENIMMECEDDETDLEICICIPYSYDLTGRNKALRNFIKTSDGVFVMNYYKGGEIENIKREAALARWYKKRIVNVYELQPGLLSQTNNSITYYKDGLEAVNTNYKELLEAYPNHDIGIGYHTLEYLKILSFENNNQ